MYHQFDNGSIADPFKSGPIRRHPAGDVRRDVVTSDAKALLTLGLAISCPPRHETIVLMLDDDRRGLGVVIVSGTIDPEHVLNVAECVARTSEHGGATSALVIASIRPGHVGHSDGDDTRWLDLTRIADDAGVELLEWYVIGDEVSYPRHQLGEPPRW